jgi:arginine decarboxylase
VDVDKRRRRNEARAHRERERGPARDDPHAIPVTEAIDAFYERGDLVFAIPAHRAGTGEAMCDAVAWAGEQAFRADLGMNKGVDNRHQSWQVQPTAMQLFAKAVGAEETLFSTNGSTENVHVAIMTAVRPGETIAIARNGHKSAFAGLVLSGAWPVYVDPVYDARWQVAHGVDPVELERTLAEHPQARAAMVFTPSYYGVSADVKALAKVAHDRGIPLLSDDAWGLDYSFCSRLPPSALESGSDLAIGSVHKTLSGLGQTSVLSVQGELIDRDRLHLVFELEQSTSASALLIASIDAARHQFQHDGERLLGRAIDHAHRLRAEIQQIPGLELMDEDILGPGATALDPTHVTIDVRGLGLTGYSAADWLQQHQGIHMELSDHRRVMALITYADTDENIDRLTAALHALVEHRREPDYGDIPEMPAPAQLRTETVMLPRDAFLGATEMVPWRQAPGRVSAEMICPYPPGIPVIAPGEVLTTDIVDYLQHVAAAGGMIEGAADESAAKLRVVTK